jgi:energy-coupling factor transport system permease protein
MSFDVGLGQYYEAKSPIHSLDPRAKLFFVLIFMIATFVARNVVAFIPIVVFVILWLIVSRVPALTVLKGLKSLAFIVLFTAALNVFFTKGENLLFNPIEIIPNVWTLTAYREGLINAGILAGRIIVLLVGTTLFLSYTTTPIELTD